MINISHSHQEIISRVQIWEADNIVEAETDFASCEVTYSLSTQRDMLRVWEIDAQKLIGWVDLEHGIWVPNE